MGFDSEEEVCPSYHLAGAFLFLDMGYLSEPLSSTTLLLPPVPTILLGACLLLFLIGSYCSQFALTKHPHLHRFHSNLVQNYISWTTCIVPCILSNSDHTYITTRFIFLKHKALTLSYPTVHSTASITKNCHLSKMSVVLRLTNLVLYSYSWDTEVTPFIV